MNRKQIRLLTVSAGDHERMPEEDTPQGEIDLTTGKEPDEFEIKKKHFDRIRKSVVSQGGKIAYKSPVVDKYIGTKVKPDFKPIPNPIKGRRGQGEPQVNSMTDMIDMARKGQGSIGLGNKLKKKLSRGSRKHG